MSRHALDFCRVISVLRHFRGSGLLIGRSKVPCFLFKVPTRWCAGTPRAVVPSALSLASSPGVFIFIIYFVVFNLLLLLLLTTPIFCPVGFGIDVLSALCPAGRTGLFSALLLHSRGDVIDMT